MAEEEQDYGNGVENGSVAYSNGYEETQAGPSRKRPRAEEEAPKQNQNASFQPRRPRHEPQLQVIMPSMFGVAPRNDFTRTVGEFIMANCMGRDHIEIEIKLGTLMSASQGLEPPRRIRLPAMSETILPSDYPVGNFSSNMNKKQNQSLNRLLNSITSESQKSPYPIQFQRAQHVDSFYGGGNHHGKARVSRTRDGQVIENGVMRKTRIGDLNVFSPREGFDWRVSVSTEEPAELPTNQPIMVRDKDRACYRHQLCQVDLTVVTAKDENTGSQKITYELEIEILDPVGLIAEGMKEQQGLPNRFDEILQSCLDTVRMLIRNVDS